MTTTTPPPLPNSFAGAINLDGYKLGTVDPTTHRFTSFFVSKQILVDGYLDDYFFKFTTASNGGFVAEVLGNDDGAVSLQTYDSSQRYIGSTTGYAAVSTKPSQLYYVDAKLATGAFTGTFDVGLYLLPVNPATYKDADHDSAARAINLGSLAGTNAVVSRKDSLFMAYKRQIPATTSATGGAMTVLSDTRLVNDRADYYKFSLPSAGKLTITASGTYGSMFLVEPPQGNAGRTVYQPITGTQTLNLAAGSYAIYVYDTATKVLAGSTLTSFTYDWEFYNAYGLKLSFASNRVDLTASVANLRLGSGGNTTAPSIKPGATGSFDVTLRNVGGQSVGTDVGIYISKDATITTSDRLVIYSSLLNPVPANGRLSYAATFTVPLDLKPGTYYIGVVVDHDHMVQETNEANNASKGMALTVTPGTRTIAAARMSLAANGEGGSGVAGYASLQEALAGHADVAGHRSAGLSDHLSGPNAAAMSSKGVDRTWFDYAERSFGAGGVGGPTQTERGDLTAHWASQSAFDAHQWGHFGAGKAF